tara:strand:- start:45 stop:203 length:159 start_codon:yes stop_codon:yes gene_type:complete
METRILAEDIMNCIIQRHPTVGKLMENEVSYEDTVDLIKDLLDQDLQLKDLK